MTTMEIERNSQEALNIGEEECPSLINIQTENSSKCSQEILSVCEETDHVAVSLKYSYSLKIINGFKKSDYKIHNFHNESKFADMASLNSFIRQRFVEFAGSDDICIGYIEPGHGWKGKQVWLNTNEDLNDLYTVCNRARRILLWCYLPMEIKRKHKLENCEEETPSKKPKCCISSTRKIDKDQLKFEKLCHKLSSEQLQNLSFTLQSSKKDSVLATSPKLVSKEEKPQEVVPVSNVSSSPSRIHARTECIEQLQKINSLLEKGIISKEQYDNIQEVIIKDILWHSN